MSAIFKREFKSFFTTPLGYVILMIFNAFGGIYFWFGTLRSGTVEMSYVFSNFTLVILAAMPVLTMRLFSEERRQKTDQALLTAPVSLVGIVSAKFLAAFLLYIISISSTLIYSVIVANLVAVSFDFWAYVLGSYLGLVLFGAAFIAIGILISSMTENQIVAAILTYAVMILLLTLGDIANMLPLPFLASALYWLSFETKYNAFVSGVVSLDNILFFISVTVVCLFMTTRVLEKRRWS